MHARYLTRLKNKTLNFWFVTKKSNQLREHSVDEHLKCNLREALNTKSEENLALAQSFGL